MSRPNPICLADFTRPELLVPMLKSTTPAEVVAELTDQLDRTGMLENRKTFLDAVIARERLSPTACSPGWALPHARLAELPELIFALGKSFKPLAWAGGQSVNTVWLFAVPEGETKAYLNLVASVARFSQNTAQLAKLSAASDASLMFEVMGQVPLCGSRPPVRENSFQLP
ncbi:MAG TPA: PTS sugar transporter subunit IIA [Verrucomicrobiae bacterium]|nr:PTS sugar transporter subunit IIA [Verrucomicrobiae bacterium]